MIRISGFFTNYSDADLLKLLIKDNNDILNSTSTLKIIQRFTYKKSETYGVKIAVDPISFSRIMKNGDIRIVSCPKCGGAHGIADCVSIYGMH